MECCRSRESEMRDGGLFEIEMDGGTRSGNIEEASGRRDACIGYPSVYVFICLGLWDTRKIGNGIDIGVGRFGLRAHNIKNRSLD